MSALSRLRKQWNYETNVPRCEVCKNYRRGKTFLRNSLPVTSQPLCKLGSFTVKPTACCDKFVGLDGTTLY